MSRTKAGLPDATKLDYRVVNGAPTVDIAATLTTRAQITALTEQLDKLAGLMPEPKVRKAARNGPTVRAPRAPRATPPASDPRQTDLETVIKN